QAVADFANDHDTGCNWIGVTGDPNFDLRMIAHQIADRVGVQEGRGHYGPSWNGSLRVGGRRPSAISCSSSSTHAGGTFGNLSTAARTPAAVPGVLATGVTTTSVPSIK